MAGMTTTGTEELSRMFEQLGEEAGHIAAKALYDGADVVADAYNAAVASIQTEPFKYVTEGSGQQRLPSPEEKAMLQRKAGIAKFRKAGSEVQTLVGIAEGYGGLVGRRKAYKQIANAINSGTSFMVKQPVFRKAASQSRAAAQAAMIRTAEAEIKKITG